MTVTTGQETPRSQMAGFTRPDTMEMKAPKEEPLVPPQEGEARETGDEETPEPQKMSYLERLGVIKVSLEEALGIIDQMAVNGEYSEEYKLSPSIKGRISTRSTRFNSFLAEKIDLLDPKKMGRMQQLMSEYQLAASLDSYGDITFPKLEDDLPMEEWLNVLTTRHQFVRSLKSHVMVKLCEVVGEMDVKLTIIFSQGYEEHF